MPSKIANRYLGNKIVDKHNIVLYTAKIVRNLNVIVTTTAALIKRRTKIHCQ